MSLFKDDDDFSVDRFQLELEAERNAGLMRKYGKLLAHATAQTKEERRKLNFLESELGELIRLNKKHYGITGSGRPSDKVIFGLVQGEPDYIKQFNRYLMAVRREEDYKSAIDTCKQRGMMIRVLTEQWLNNYYSKPIVYDPKLKQSKRIKLNTRLNEEDNQTDDDIYQVDDY